MIAFLILYTAGRPINKTLINNHHIVVPAGEEGNKILAKLSEKATSRHVPFWRWILSSVMILFPSKTKFIRMMITMFVKTRGLSNAGIGLLNQFGLVYDRKTYAGWMKSMVNEYKLHVR